MVDANELKEQEIEMLKEEGTYDLETLIIEGQNVRIPVIFDYPLPNGKTAEVTCKLKPLTNVEVNNARRTALKNQNTTMEIEMLKIGMYTSKDKPFPRGLIKEMPTGVVVELAQKLIELSGVKIDREEQLQLAKEIMDF